MKNFNPRQIVNSFSWGSWLVGILLVLSASAAIAEGGRPADKWIPEAADVPVHKNLVFILQMGHGECGDVDDFPQRFLCISKNKQKVYDFLSGKNLSPQTHKILKDVYDGWRVAALGRALNRSIAAAGNSTVKYETNLATFDRGGGKRGVVATTTIDFGGGTTVTFKPEAVKDDNNSPRYITTAHILSLKGFPNISQSLTILAAGRGIESDTDMTAAFANWYQQVFTTSFTGYWTKSKGDIQQMIMVEFNVLNYLQSSPSKKNRELLDTMFEMFLDHYKQGYFTTTGTELSALRIVWVDLETAAYSPIVFNE